ncbi:hypothetical protein ILUMI_06624, partial [Ignelater luminosus]
MWFVVAVALLALIYYMVGIKPYNYWKQKGVPYLKPLPVVGNLGPNVFGQLNISELMEIFYYSYPNARYVGVYQLLMPAFLVRDPELIKKITVKEFDSFPDHRALVPEDTDPLWNKNLFSLKSEAGWQDMRATLSPSFTSSKMKMMYGLMKDCSRQFVDYYQKQGGFVEMEMKDAFSRYTNDVIATTAFGIVCDSLKDQNNDFYLMGKDASDFNGLRALKAFLYSLSPTLMKMLKLGMIPRKVDNFFRGIIIETLNLRREKGVIRPDMIHLLLEAQKDRLKRDDIDNVLDSGFAVAHEAGSIKKPAENQKAEITDEDITAQALLFFLAGFETTSSLLSFTIYELALNTDIQQKLYEEIDECYKNYKGDFTYEAVLGMKYLDMVTT